MWQWICSKLFAEVSVKFTTSSRTWLPQALAVEVRNPGATTLKSMHLSCETSAQKQAGLLQLASWHLRLILILLSRTSWYITPRFYTLISAFGCRMGLYWHILTIFYSCLIRPQSFSTFEESSYRSSFEPKFSFGSRGLRTLWKMALGVISLMVFFWEAFISYISSRCFIVCPVASQNMSRWSWKATCKSQWLRDTALRMGCWCWWQIRPVRLMALKEEKQRLLEPKPWMRQLQL